MKADSKDIALNFSGMFDSEGFSLFPWVRPVEMWDILGTNCFCDDDSQAEIARRLAGLPFDAVHWIDAGDYHYVSKIRAGLIDRPFDIVMFDNHPDTHESDFSEMLNCGGWLYTALGTNPNLDHAIVAGIDPDLESECVRCGDKVTVLPGHVDDEEFFDAVSESNLPVFLTIDLDVMDKFYFHADWTQGEMDWNKMKTLLKGLLDRRAVIGIDICGGVPPGQGGTKEDFRTNMHLRAMLHEFFYLNL
ncbi:MAG: arginase family protein [Bacteroidales bacterium]|nr:arginase family protein [Bacteroidales bacterium]MBQ2526728.1 arginase family protein [Bacteroidales bacterium]